MANNAPFYVNMCVVPIYYVVHKHENLTQIAIHLRMHDHLVVEGHSREVVEQVKSLVKEVFQTPWATSSAIELAANKTLILSEHLLNEDGKGPMEVLKGDKLCQMMDMFITLFLPNVWNF
jgi:hypothetical protein